MLRIICTLFCLVLWREAAAFAPVGGRASHAPLRTSPPPPSSELHLSRPRELDHERDRRAFLARQLLSPVLAFAAALAAPPSAGASVPLTDKLAPDVPPFAGGATDARERFRAAVVDVDALLADYDAIAGNGGGDTVRLYLGTQGVKSHMYGITKVLRSLKEEAEDIVEYTEALDEFEAYLFQAEGAAYQSMFAEHSSAKSTSESLLRTARGDIVNMRKFMGTLASQLKVEV